MVEAIYYFPDGSAGGPPEARQWLDGEVFESTKEAVEAIQSRYGNHGTWVDWDGNLCVHESGAPGCGGVDSAVCCQGVCRPMSDCGQI